MLQRNHARRLFWFVLALASLASIAGNAAHALMVPDLTVSTQQALAVAIGPPVVLMLSIEMVRQLVLILRPSTAMFWIVLTPTVFLAALAFRLSFESLRDLASLSGVPGYLAWAWPLIIDLPIAQATLGLVALVRSESAARVTSEQPAATEPAVEAGPQRTPVQLRHEPQVTEFGDLTDSDDADYERLAEDVLRARRIRQSPETVAQVLAMGEDGVKVNEIATRTDLHHSTVRRILGAAQMAEAR